MGVYLLIAAGIVFSVLLALNNLLKTIFRRAQIGFVDTLLTFLTTLVPLAGLIIAQNGVAASLPGASAAQTVDNRVTLGALVIGGGLAVFSLIILLMEVFRPQRLKGSRGVMGLYSGLLIIAAVFIVPISHTLLTPATPTAIVEAVSAVNGTDEASSTPRATFTSTAHATDTPEPSDTPRPTRTPSRTPFRFSTRTPTPTPTLVTPCVASVQYNLRLRAAPNKDADTLLTIPFGTTIDLFGKGTASDDKGALWWYTVYADTAGWVDGQYMLVSAACDSLPLREES